MTKSRHILPPRRRYTADELALIERLYPDRPTAEIARQLGTKVGRIYQLAARLGLKKSEAYLASPAACRLRRGDEIGKATRFKAGQSTWNKGLSYMPGGRGAEFRFKKGHRGGRALEIYKPIGTKRISKDGYLERKINDDMPLQKRWRAVHLIEWEAVNGPLPKGHAIVFRDGDKRNIALANLELVTRAELMRRNSYHNNYPKEIAQAIQLRGALVRKINRLRKEGDEQRDHHRRAD